MTRLRLRLAVDGRQVRVTLAWRPGPGPEPETDTEPPEKNLGK